MLTFNYLATQRNRDFLRVYDGNNTIYDALLIATSGTVAPSQVVVVVS